MSISTESCYGDLPVWTDLYGAPCPKVDGFQYEIDAGLIRTEYENGLSRQRRRYKTRPTQYTLNWTVNQQNLRRIELSALAIGYDWMYMPLVTGLISEFIAMDHPIRFTGNLQISVNQLSRKYVKGDANAAHDVLWDVSVTAEQHQFASKCMQEILFPPPPPPVLPIITSPNPQTILTVSAAVTVYAKAPSDNRVRLYYDGALLGDMTLGDNGFWAYTWTPGVLDYEAKLTAVGTNGGTSAELTVVVAEANPMVTNINVWNLSNPGMAVTVGQGDPNGGTTAYLVTLPTATNTEMFISKLSAVVPTAFNSGFEVWVKPNGCNVLGVDPNEGGTHYGYIDLTTGQSLAVGAYIKIMETKLGWYRVWFQQVNESTVGPRTFRLYMCHAVDDKTPDTAAGQGMWFWLPRPAPSGALPFTTYQKLSAYRTATSAGVELWAYRHPYMNDEASVSAVTPNALDVIKPTTWTEGVNYHVFHALPAVPRATEDAIIPFKTGNYADMYNGVIVMPHEYPGSELWWGRKTDGSCNQHDFIAEVMVPFSQEFLGGRYNSDRHFLIGYGKSANGAWSLKLRHPELFGYAAGWDGRWYIDWVTDNVALNLPAAFTDYNNWLTYDPWSILPSKLASVNDKTRLVITGYELYASDQSQMVARLDTNAVGYLYNSVDRGVHSYSSGWLSDAFARLAVISGIPTVG